MKNSALATAAQIAEGVSDPPQKPIRDLSRLTRAEISALLKLHEAGKTQVEIAQALGCSQPTVSYWLNEYGDTRSEAVYTLRNGAQKLAERIVKQADVTESIDVLERLEVIAPKHQEASRGGVQIIIGMPGSPAGPDPLIQVNETANYQTQHKSEGQQAQSLTAPQSDVIEAKAEGRK